MPQEGSRQHKGLAAGSAGSQRDALGNVFQITSDETLTWDQIYQTVADALGVELKAVHVASEFLDEVGKELDTTERLTLTASFGVETGLST